MASLWPAAQCLLRISTPSLPRSPRLHPFASPFMLIRPRIRHLPSNSHMGVGRLACGSFMLVAITWASTLSFLRLRGTGKLSIQSPIGRSCQPTRPTFASGCLPLFCRSTWAAIPFSAWAWVVASQWLAAQYLLCISTPPLPRFSRLHPFAAPPMLLRPHLRQPTFKLAHGSGPPRMWFFCVSCHHVGVYTFVPTVEGHGETINSKSN